MKDVASQYIQSINPDNLVWISELGIVCDMLIIKYWYRTSFEPFPEGRIEGIPEGGIQQVGFESWKIYSEVLNRNEFFTWCIDNIDDYDRIIDLNTEWDSNAELI